MSLNEREAPLVMVGTGSTKPGLDTFEALLGRQSGHPTPVSGTVSKVTKKAVTIRDEKGKQHAVQLYDNFPLNDPKAVLHSTPTVVVGAKVEAGQTVADTNFMKDGKLALGRNLRVAYVPFKGYNFEDGVVLSETAAKKLSSLHLHKPSIMVDDQLVMNPKKFAVHHPGAFSREQLSTVGEDGVVRVGTRVESGDPLVVAMRPYQLKDRMGLGAIRRSLSGQHSDVSLRWESDYPGEVVGTSRDRKGQLTVHVRSTEPMQIGDKIAGRHGNKGIVSLILPDKEMPHTKDGKHIEVALNPSGVPGRINVGQVLETAAAKIAEKTKKPYIVDNFDHGDALEKIKSELKAHGLTDTEELHDPVTGVSLGKALVGPQYMLKLTHQIDKKIAARAGMGLPGGVGEPERYDVNLMPASGGKTGGQRLDPLTLNVMLAHGARANIREAQTWKSEGADPQTNEAKRWPSQHTEVWTAIQSGTPIPLPRPTFAFQKFTDMLRASGINIEKKGQTFQLSPMTDKQVLAMSNGALPRPIMLTKSKLDKNGEPEPYPGGLFDPQITGGHGGKKWSHIKLSEPVPNPIFEGAIRGILGLTTKQYSDLVGGEQAVTKKGEFVPLGTAGSLTGGHAIKHLLDQINVEKELEETKAKLSSTVKAKGVDASNVDKMVKKVKHLQALDRIGIKPADAYVLSNLPVIPPVMRPVSMLPGGKIRWADLNGLYAKFAQVNQELGDPEIRKTLPESRLKSLRADMYDGVRAIVGVGTAGSSPGKQRGFLEQISGSAPKFGYFQRTLMNRRQDLSMRSVIVPEPALGLDEVGIPEKKASTLFRPFVVRKMVEIGSAANPLEAQELIKKETKSARRALELVMQERPVILKRDPALHKHSALAFTPKLVSGRAIQIHPLVTSGFNADFDGDTMSAYVPISRDAVEEARKMYPSNNLFNEATGKIMYQPTLESALGLYKLSLVKDGKTKHFSAPVDVLKAVQTRTLDVNHPITVGSMKTTAGRLLLADALPEPMRDAVLKGTDPIDKKGLDKLFTTLAKNHAQDFGTAANRLKDLGNGMAFGAIEVRHPNTQGPTAIMAKESPGRHLQFLPVGTHTLSLDDFKADKASRDPVFNRAHQEVDALDNLSISGKERDLRTINIWKRAGKEVEEAHRAKIQKDPSNLAIMQMAGVKPSWDQYKQMVIAPVLVTDAAGAIIPRPITRSYSEGLGVGDYWTQMSGARRGNVMKVQEVSEPGALSKRFVASAMNLVVTGHDCGTHNGVALPVSSNDVHDRILAHDFSAKGFHVPAGTLLSPDVVTKIRTADKNASIVVRSPLKCEHGAGLCQKCAGLAPTGKFYELGTNTGLLAAQSLGERSVQVTLKAFHSGGVVSSGGHQVTDDFTRIEQLTKLPTDIPDAAVLSHVSGTVKKIEKDATGVKIHVGDHSYHVGKDRYGRGLHENLPRAPEMPGYKPWAPPKVGDKIEAGQQLTDPNRTLINPHDLYKATKSMERVQNFLTDELHGIYSREGVRRQHVETIVKALGNLTKVRDPGDAENILPGEFQPYSKVRAMNAELVKAGKKPIEHVPVLKGVDVLPLDLQEDWMAKLQHNNLRATLQEAASTAGISYLHGLHPVPGIAYGAEFGLTGEHAKRPGLEHLKNVPAYAY